MKRYVVLVAVLLISGFVAISVWKQTRNDADHEVADRPGLSEERKVEIRRFWQIYRRASDLKRQGEWEVAGIAYREALEIDPRHEDALYYYGNVLFELEQYGEAVAVWRRLIEVNPLSTRAHIQLGAVYSCGAQGASFDLDIAEREFQRALAINKEETGPILKLGEVYLLRGRWRQALTYFKTAMQSNSKSVETHYLIGYLKWREGDQEAALGALQRAATLSGADEPAGLPLGEGATRTAGGGPILAEGASRRSFFAPHWMALKTWEHKGVSRSRMVDEYQKLDHQLSILVNKRRVQ